jgi:hypothetical protein
MNLNQSPILTSYTDTVMGSWTLSYDSLNLPVFGLVRAMSGASTARKFDAEEYIRHQSAEGETLPGGGCGGWLAG